MSQIDTIVALATPYGYGGIGILRVSGSLSSKVAYEILKQLPKPRQATYLPFFDSNDIILDKGIALFFPKPNSFTGEDVLELHGHGGPIVLDLLLKRILTLNGIRIANPGEFSERAFLNNKLDLIQAEAIADLINAESVQAVRMAINSVQGLFSNKINKLIKDIINLRTHIESSIDFPNENIDYLSYDNIKNNINKIINNIKKLRDNAHQGNIVRNGIRVVIVGEPNVGKSTLLNALTGHESAIVTSISGTTRDAIHEHICINGISIHIVDTAGLHETNDDIERIGIKFTWREIKKADHILLIIDSTITSFNLSEMLHPTFTSYLPKKIPITIIRNKADLTGENMTINKIDGYTVISLSAKVSNTVNLLKEHLKHCIGLSINTENFFLARRRHIKALEQAEYHLLQSKKQLNNDIFFSEFLADELRLAHQELSTMTTGKFNSNDLLKTIFSNFCIGK